MGDVPAPEGCGQAYFDTYGQPDAYQSGPGFNRDPVERASGDSFGDILVLATNDESQWSGGRYLPAGAMTVCTSYPWLPSWRCQNGTMNAAGQLVGFGPNSQGYDRAK